MIRTNGRTRSRPRRPPATFTPPRPPRVPPEITRITALTGQDLTGEAIDVTAAAKLVADAHLVVAHNASFDRPFLEAIVPAAQAAAWACSRHEVPWHPATFPSRSLACLLCAYGAFSPDRHRALADAEADLWLVTQQLPGENRTVFAALRETAAQPTVRIWAAGAPFSVKDELKSRGYRWMPHERNRIPRSWWTDVAPADLEAEFAWLAEGEPAPEERERRGRVDTGPEPVLVRREGARGEASLPPHRRPTRGGGARAHLSRLLVLEP